MGYTGEANAVPKKYWIIDEKSMLSLKSLYWMDRRARQVTRNNLPFGGLNVILVGDTCQLPPVRALPLYSTNTSKMNTEQKNGFTLYQKFTTVVELTQVMRQLGPEQQKFRDTLMRIRLGKANSDDYKLLQTRFMGWGISADFDDAPCLMFSNDKRDEHNMQKLKSFYMLTNRCRTF